MSGDDAVRSPRLFDAGLFGPHVDAARERIRQAIIACVLPLAEAAEANGLFPREAVAKLGAQGLFRERWRDGPPGDPGFGVLLAEENGRLLPGGIASGLSVHAEGVASILATFGRTALLRDYLGGVLDGKLVGCIGVSEPAAGSDAAGVRTSAVREGEQWRVRGEKKYLSLGLVCDIALLLCTVGGEGGPLALFAVPATSLTPRKRHVKAGASSLDTTSVQVDALVPADAMLGGAGQGLLAASWGLSHERLAVAAQVTGACGRAIGLAAAHLHRRVQFGRPLVDHQVLRLRLADLSARLLTLRYAVYAAAAGVPVPGACGAREVAALKVTAARLAQEVMTECMHMFGGAGYLEDATPLARMWRDAPLARLGAGTDEMMWELVAGGMVPDFAAYDEAVQPP